ncbi:MAG: T9SS type A sorting domain-containing protein [Flavobacteriaceae bacterium]
MIKKYLGSLLLGLVALSGFSQTIVSTTAENKKVILEEFTGIHCVYCPQGHAIAQAIQNNNPGDVFLINVHVGSFAVPGANEPDFRTSFGTAIANQSQLVGYPAGTVNRHYFPGMAQNGGTGTAMNRGNWTSAANQTLALNSYLNMAVEGDIDVQTNELTVHVEAYYTGTSPQSSNKLNVALLQNNTLGPQTGGNAGNEYVHQHRLIHMVTGQWGDDVSPTTNGTFIDRTYTYTIPEMHNNVPIKIEDLEIVVFMTETTQEIISGNGSFPTYSNFEFQNDAAITLIQEIPDQCGFNLAPVIEIQNVGENPLTSIDINYSINGGTTETFTWTGNLTSLQREMVELPAIPYDLEVSNSLSIALANDDNTANNTSTSTFNQTTSNTNDITLRITTDGQGSQCTWEIVNLAGDIMQSGGPYPNNTTINESFTFDGDCYKFILYDSGANGGSGIFLRDGSNDVILYSNGADYEDKIQANFSTEGFLGIESNPLQRVSLFPNPAQTYFTITNADNANIKIYDILGKQLLVQKNISNNQSIDVANLSSGTYFISIEKDNYTSVQKLIINK